MVFVLAFIIMVGDDAGNGQAGRPFSSDTGDEGHYRRLDGVGIGRSNPLGPLFDSAAATYRSDGHLWYKKKLSLENSHLWFPDSRKRADELTYPGCYMLYALLVYQIKEPLDPPSLALEGMSRFITFTLCSLRPFAS